MDGFFYIAEGLVIAYQGLIYEYRVRIASELQFENPETGKLLTLSEQDFFLELQSRAIRIVDAFSSPKQLQVPDLPDPGEFQSTVRLDQFPERWQKDLERKLCYVRALIALGISRGQLTHLKLAAAKVASEMGDARPPAPSTLSNWIKCFQRSHGDPSVLLSRHPMRKRTLRTPATEEALINDAIENDFETSRRCSITTAHQAYLDADRPKGSVERPVCYRTFATRIHRKNQETVDISRIGRTAARQDYRMARAQLPAASPLDFVETDHTLLNLYAIDDYSFTPLGRPTLTVIRDRYSRIILGFYLSFDSPSLNSVHGALRHSLCAHTSIATVWPDLENPWPAHGVGATYVSDHGVEFMSPRYRMAITSLGAEYLYCGVKTPWHKAPVERFFETLESSFLEAVPGKTFRSLKDRKDYDPRRHAVVRFSTLVYLLHKWCVDAHNAKPNRSLCCSPLDKWIEGTRDSPPAYVASLDRLSLQFGEARRGRLRHDGIQYLHLHYADNKLEALRKEIGTKQSVNFVVDPADLGQIYVQHPHDKHYFSVSCTRSDYARGLTQFQHRYLLGASENGSDKSVDQLRRTRKIIRERLADELERHGSIRKKDLRTALIDSNAVLAGHARSVMNPFASSIEAISEEEPVVSTSNPPQPEVAPISNIVAYDVEMDW